jgi:hypothetical protein
MLSTILGLLAAALSPHLMQACVTEDSAPASGCYWHASSQGNGEGRSFTVFENGTIVYWN